MINKPLPRTMEECFQWIRDSRTYQRKLWSETFDDKATAEQWTTYVVRYLGKAIAGPPINKETFLRNMLTVASLAIAAIEAVGRTGELIKRDEDGK